MSEFTISSAHTLLSCRYPFRDDVAMPPELGNDRDRDRGKEFHACAANYINKKEAPESLTSPLWLSGRAWILANWKEGWVAEPAYAWDPTADTARLLGVDIDRGYEKAGKLPHEKAGTLDVCFVDGDTVYVYEFGTGFDVEHKHDQMRLQCLVAARAHGATRAVGQLVRFTDEAAYPSPPVEFDDFALSAIAGEFAELLASVPGSSPQPGEHCGRCNLAPVCPETSAIVAQIIPAEALTRHKWDLVIESPEHAVWLQQHARLVKAAAERVTEGIKEYVAAHGPQRLEDGTELYEGTRKMPRFDAAKFRSIAIEVGVTEEQVESCSYIAIESAGLKVRKPAAAKSKRGRAASDLKHEVVKYVPASLMKGQSR